MGLNNPDLDFLEWVDDDAGQDPEILLLFWDSFPGIPSSEELIILKRKAKEQFPISQYPQANFPLARKKKKPLMAWNPAMVRAVEAQALERGVNPWEVVKIRKKSWQIGLRKLRARHPHLHKKG